MSDEPVPLAAIQACLLQFLRGREDAAVFGAQAVNAYAGEPRMTQDVDIVSPRAERIAAEIRDDLARRFGIAARVRTSASGRAFRVDQVRKPRNRHLADVRWVERLPPTRRHEDVLVVAPEELIAQKVIALHRRKGSPKAGTDWRDVAVLLLAFPDLKRDEGPVRTRLVASGAEPGVLDEWASLVAQEIVPADDDEF